MKTESKPLMIPRPKYKSSSRGSERVYSGISNDALELVNPPKVVDFINGEVVDVK
jgi:hypothetical protein